MNPSRFVRALGLVLIVVGAGEPALAACTDVAQPGVYWRRCVQDGQDLRGVDLTQAVLRDAFLRRTNLSEADLSGVDARRANFGSAAMQDTILDDANLTRADLTNADLRGASLRNADLTMARLYRVDLRGADFTGARLDRADLHQARLGGATWVDGVTICSDDSIGQCHASRDQREVSGVEPSG